MSGAAAETVKQAMERLHIVEEMVGELGAPGGAPASPAAAEPVPPETVATETARPSGPNEGGSLPVDEVPDDNAVKP